MGIFEEANRMTLSEEPIPAMLRKQASVTKLFPPFYDRVKAVAAAGGIHLVDEDPGLWTFEVASATTPGKTYTINVEFRDIVNQIHKLVKNRQLWNKDQTHVDLRKVADEMMDDADVKILCTCPAFQYWGPAYITTKRKSKYGDQETRPPNVRNPKQYGLGCKHAQLMFDVLPFYKGTMAGHLKRYFSKEVAKAEEASQKEMGGVKKGAEFLAKKQEEKPKPKPPVKAEPKVAPKAAPKPEPKAQAKPPIKPGQKPPDQKGPKKESVDEFIEDDARNTGDVTELELLCANGNFGLQHAQELLKQYEELSAEFPDMVVIKDAEAESTVMYKEASMFVPTAEVDYYKNMLKARGIVVDIEHTPDGAEIKVDEDASAAEKEAHFEERTKMHIGLVQKAIEKICSGTEWKDGFAEMDLIERGKTHDASKFNEPERTPYIAISWRHKQDNFKGYKTPGQLPDASENEATIHHITTNSHHPEFHLADKSQANISKENRDKSDFVVDATAMPPLDIGEMVADWWAMSEELKTNTAREWFDKQKDVRWHFSEEQEAMIDKLLKRLEGVSENINEGAKHFEYQPGGDKQELLYDFYILNMLPLYGEKEILAQIKDPGMGSSWHVAWDGELQYALMTNRKTINKYLQQHMLEAVFFSLTCEFRHIFDSNAPEVIMAWAEEIGYADFMKKYSQYFYIKQGGKGIYLDKPEMLRPHTNDEVVRQNTYQAVESTKIDHTVFVRDIAKSAYGGGVSGHKIKWSASYGGPAWERICNGWLRLASSSEEDLIIWIDHVYDLQHNTNTVFNKLQSYYKDGYGWLHKSLEFKKHAKSMYELMDKASPGVRDFAAAVLKDVENTTYEAWLGQFKNKAPGVNDKGFLTPNKEPAAQENQWTILGKTYHKGDKVVYIKGTAGDKYIGKTAKITGSGGGDYVQISFDEGGMSWKANVNNIELQPVQQAQAAKAAGAFKIGDKVEYKGSNVQHLGKTAVVVSDTGNGNVKIKFDTDQSEYNASVKNLTKIQPSSWAYGTGTAAPAAEAPKAKGFKVGDKIKYIGKQQGDAYYNTGDRGTIVKIYPADAKTFGTETALVTWDNGHMAGVETAQIRKVKGEKKEKPTEIGGFKVGDKVKYTGTKTQKIVNDTGTVINFNAYNQTIAGVKWQNLGDVVWVSFKNLGKI